MGSTPNPLLGLALEYAAAGVPVFPVTGKAPTIPKSEGGNGFLDASTDPKRIMSMFNKYPSADGVGGYLGAAGMVAVDIDVNDGKDGWGDLSDLEAEHGEPVNRDTVTTRTPSNGRHLWQRMNGTPVGSRNGIAGKAIDVKGLDGYVVLPGSPGYTFEPGHDFLKGDPVAPVASWVAGYAPESSSRPTGSGEGVTVDDQAVAAWITEHSRPTAPELAAELAQRCADLAGCRVGSRHGATCGAIGWAIGHAGIGHALDLPDAIAQVHAALTEARRATGDTRNTEAEVRSIVGWIVAQQIHNDAQRNADMIFEMPDVSAVADTADPVASHLPEAVDWKALFAREVNYEWLVEDFWPVGRQLHIFAARKTGKSLVMLWIAANLAAGRDPFTGQPREPIIVIYLDYEMSEEDLLERLEDMGFTADDLGNLRYYLYPPLAPLDTREGGAGLMELVKRDQAQAVVLDTVSRVVEGKENDADTFRALWSNTGMRLKAAGVSMARLDHEGHEAGRSRGSSAKGDDVDLVWRLSVADGGYTLTKKAGRIAWVPEKIDLTTTSDPLRFTRTTGNWPAGTLALADRLAAAGAPLDVSRRKAKELLTADGGAAGKQAVLLAAIRYRKYLAQGITELTGEAA